MKRTLFNRGVAGYGLGLLLIAPLTLATDGDRNELASQAFLEFLGEWEDEQGNWQDPLEYETPEDSLNGQVSGGNVEQNDEAR